MLLLNLLHFPNCGLNKNTSIFISNLILSYRILWGQAHLAGKGESQHRDFHFMAFPTVAERF